MRAVAERPILGLFAHARPHLLIAVADVLDWFALGVVGEFVVAGAVTEWLLAAVAAHAPKVAVVFAQTHLDRKTRMNFALEWQQMRRADDSVRFLRFLAPNMIVSQQMLPDAGHDAVATISGPRIDVFADVDVQLFGNELVSVLLCPKLRRTIENVFCR